MVKIVYKGMRERQEMKANLLLAITLATCVISESYAATDFVVATNLLDSEVHTNAWEEVDLTSLPSYNNYKNVKRGQAFVPLFSGTLTTVEALIASGVAGPPLNVSIYKSNAGIPNELLGTKEFPASEFANPFASNNRKIIDFSSFQISLVAGSQYLVGFETPFGIDGVTGSGSPFFAGWAPEFFGGIPTLSLGINLSSAVNGVDWAVASNSKELGIAVRATPEPSVTFLGLAILSVGLIRRHHNRG